MTASSDDIVGTLRAKSKVEVTKAYTSGGGGVTSKSYSVDDNDCEPRPDDSITKYSSVIDASRYVDVSMVPEVPDDEEYSLESLLGSPPSSSLGATKNMAHITTASADVDVSSDS